MELLFCILAEKQKKKRTRLCNDGFAFFLHAHRIEHSKIPAERSFSLKQNRRGTIDSVRSTKFCFDIDKDCRRNL
jgi:hypothetical protein